MYIDIDVKLIEILNVKFHRNYFKSFKRKFML